MKRRNQQILTQSTVMVMKTVYHLSGNFTRTANRYCQINLKIDDYTLISCKNDEL